MGSQLHNHRSNLPPCIGRVSSHHWMPGKSLIVFFSSRKPSKYQLAALMFLALANCCGQSTLFLNPSSEMTSGSPAAVLACHPSSVNPAYQNVVTSSFKFSSVQFSCPVMSNYLQPHEAQHARPPCPSPTPGAYPNPCPLSQ